MNKKTTVILLTMTTASIFAQEIFKGWAPTKKEDHAIPQYKTVSGGVTTLRGAADHDWFLLNAVPVPATKNDKVKITWTVSGKGKVQVGFFGYKRGWEYAGTKWKACQLEGGKKEFTVLLDVPREATIVRPAITVTKGSRAAFSRYEFTVQKNANPQLNAVANPDRPGALYQDGEKAVFTCTAKYGTQVAKTGKAVVSFVYNGSKTEKREFDLSKKNPFTVDCTMKDPGFVLVLCDVTGIPGCKDVKGIQLGGAGFSPEKIKAAKPAPADLISYWHKEYAKLCQKVPANVQKVKVKGTRTHDCFRITADYYDGKKIFASLTVPKKAGKYPMVFTVPPAGNTVYQNTVYPNMITLTISVHENEKYQNHAYYMKDQKANGWYMYRSNGTREGTFYYRPILGVQRIMDYAVKEIPEWDGKHLAAVGRSQGGCFAFIMAALNDKIQAVSADVPGFCDMDSESAGRKSHIFLGDPAGSKARPFITYFDGASFAAYVKCPAVVSAGFIDTMCPPYTIYAAYNNLQGEKKFVHCVTYGHGWGLRSSEYDKETLSLLEKTFRK